MPHIIALAEASKHNIALVGGKSANLGELLAAGFPVPNGFVVTTDAFREYAGDALPSSFVDDLADAFRDAGFTSCAVRSSAVGEDGKHHSYAGLHATFYDIDASTLVDAVQRCWASLHSQPAHAYRAAIAHSADNPGADQPATDVPAMAVLVQEMIPADAAGVCFTRHPLGADRILVEACWGLGAALVDGRVSPDQFEITNTLEPIAQRIGRKRHRVVSAADPFAQHQLDPLPISMQQSRVLEPDQVRAVAELALQCKTYFGTDQDMEWALASGSLYLLQSRPITGPPASVGNAAGEDARWVKFKPVTENFTEAMTPLTQDLLRRILLPMGRFIRGRYHVDGRLLSWLIPLKLDPQELLGLLELRAVPERARLDWLRATTASAALFGAYLSNGIFWHRTGQLPETALDTFTEFCRRVRNDRQQNPLQALQRLTFGTHPLMPIGNYPVQINVSCGRYFLLTGLLRRLLVRWAPAFELQQMAALCSGSELMHSRSMVLALRELAIHLHAEPELKQLVDAGDTIAALVHIDQLPRAHPFVQAYASFQKTYGHRGVRELDLIAPRWHEQPAALLALLRTHVDGDAHAHDLHGLHLAARDALHEAVPSHWRRRLLDYLIQRIRYFMALRENSRHFHIMILDVVRAKILALEHELLTAGALTCSDDIFFLHWDEIEGLVDGLADRLATRPADGIAAEYPSSYNELIKVRRRNYQRESVHETQVSDGTDVDATLLTGQGASPGIAEGIAHVMFDPTDSVLQPGEILVAPYTDPAWTPLFPAAAGIVVEVGSYLSHAGTLAREFGIACVVDVAGCTRHIQSGQRIRVDANTGHVEILS